MFHLTTVRVRARACDQGGGVSFERGPLALDEARVLFIELGSHVLSNNSKLDSQLWMIE